MPVQRFGVPPDKNAKHQHGSKCGSCSAKLSPKNASHFALQRQPRQRDGDDHGGRQQTAESLTANSRACDDRRQLTGLGERYRDGAGDEHHTAQKARPAVRNIR